MLRSKQRLVDLFAASGGIGSIVVVGTYVAIDRRLAAALPVPGSTHTVRLARNLRLAFEGLIPENGPTDLAGSI